MAESKYYFLTDRQRYVNFPFRLKEVGWLPGHYYAHKNAVLKDIYVCMSCNSRDESLTEKDGILLHTKYSPDKIHFSLIEPGTHYNTIKPAMHDELYFRFDISSAQPVRELVGEYRNFYFPKWPSKLMAELHELLHQLDIPGVADKVDQIAVQLITEIILCHIRETASAKNTVEMRIYSVANDLVSGRELADAVKRNGFSMRSFYREWKKHFDVSPKTYVQNKKLEKAKHFLTESNLNNEEIASLCGFENVKYFYSWFRKNFAISPREYRRKFLREYLPGDEL